MKASRTQMRVAAICLAFLSLTMPSLAASTKTQTPSIDEIRGKFEDRRLKFNSLQINFTIQQSYPKGSIIEGSITEGPRRGTETLRSKDENGVTVGRLLIQGDSRRLDQLQDIWSMPRSTFVESRQTNIFRISSGRNYSQTSDWNTVETTSTEDNTLLHVAIKPLAVSFMPHLMDHLSRSKSDTSLAILRWENNETTGAGKLIVIGNTDYVSKYWLGMTRSEWFLDPSREMLPVLMRSMYPDGRIGAETRIDYEQTPAIGLFPREAVVSFYNGKETPQIIYRTHVEKIDATSKIDPALFETRSPFDEPIFKELTARKAAIAKQVWANK